MWHDKAGCTFTTALDTGNLLARQYGFTFVPNAFFFDENGVIVAKQVLFWVDNPDHAAVIEPFLDGTLQPFDKVEYDETVPQAQSDVRTPALDEKDRFDDLLRQGAAAAAQNLPLEAARLWRQALQMDPGNYGLRCQILAVEYPERYYPEVDLKWQDEQIERELAVEVENDCGPDGCRIPWQQSNP